MFLSRVFVVIVAVILYTGQVAAFSPALRSLALRGAQLPASVGTIDASNTVMGVVSMDTTGESRKTPDFFAALSYLGATATEFTLIGVFLHIAQIHVDAMIGKGKPVLLVDASWSGGHHQKAFAQKQGFLHRVGDHHNGLASLFP